MMNKKEFSLCHDSDIIVTYFHHKKVICPEYLNDPFQMPHLICVCVEIRIECLITTSLFFFYFKCWFAVMDYTMCHDFDSTVFVKIQGDIKMALKLLLTSFQIFQELFRVKNFKKTLRDDKLVSVLFLNIPTVLLGHHWRRRPLG